MNLIYLYNHHDIMKNFGTAMVGKEALGLVK